MLILAPGIAIIFCAQASKVAPVVITSSTSRHSITNKSLTVPAANIVQKNNKLLTINERKNLFMNPKSFKKQTQTSNTKSQKKIGRLNLTRLAFFEQK